MRRASPTTSGGKPRATVAEVTASVARGTGLPGRRDETARAQRREEPRERRHKQEPAASRARSRFDAGDSGGDDDDDDDDDEGDAMDDLDEGEASRSARDAASDDDDDASGSTSSPHPGTDPSEERTLQELKDTLAAMPLGEILGLRSTGVRGVPLHRAMGGAAPLDDDAAAAEEEAPGSTTKRRNKNAPRELPSARPVSRYREAVPLPKRTRRDPRFSRERMSDWQFQDQYEFLEETAARDVAALRSTVKRETLGRTLSGARGRRKRRLSDEQLADARAQVTRLEQFMAEARRARALRERLRTQYAGLKLNRKELARVALEHRFDELKSKPGKLDKFMEKRRRLVARKQGRRNASASGGGDVVEFTGESSKVPLGF